MGGFFRQYAWVIDLVGILLCSFLLAKIAGVYLGKALEVKRSVSAVKAAEAEPAERRQVDISEYAVIVDRNIFDATDRSAAAAGEEGAEGPAEEAEPTGEAVYLSGSPREEMVHAIGLWVNKQVAGFAAQQNQAAALSDLTPLLSDGDRKLLLDRRLSEAGDYEGEERRKEEA